MTTLERRDRRRATVVAAKVWKMYADNPFAPFKDGALPLIAAALKREREEASVAAAQWFLFSGKNERAKVKRVLSKPGAKAIFGAVKEAKGKR